MKLAVLCFFFLSISTGLAQVLSNPPEFKVAFDYSMIDIMQANIIQPFIESKIKEIQLNQTFSVNKLGITASIGNVSIYDFALDWNNTHILAVNANNQPAIMIQGLNVTVQFDADIKFLGINFPGQADKISIVNMDLEIALGFGTLPNETSYAYIASVTPSIQAVNADLSPKIENFLFEFIKKLGSVFGANLPDIICNVLTTQIEGFNQTVINMTTQGVNQVLLDVLQVQLSLADAPQIFNVDHDAYQGLSFNLEITNVQTGTQAITAVSDNLPPYVDGGLPIQVLLSENMISQLLWAVMESGKVNLVMSQGNVPAGFPIPLNTNALKILFPNIAQVCGAGHGVYIQIRNGGDFPIAFIRDGRLVAEVYLQVDVYVDQDDEEYPVKDLATCQNCTDYVTLNVTAFAALDVYAINSTFLGAKLMNVEIGNVDVLNGTLDAPLFRTTLNGLIVPIMGQLNLQIADGFQNPIIGMFGIDNFAVELGSDYLLVGLNMEVASTQEDSDDINMLSSYLTGFI